MNKLKIIAALSLMYPITSVAVQEGTLGLIPLPGKSPATETTDRLSTDISPAIATVITRREISVFGYKDLFDALIAVTGLHMGQSGTSVRGFTTSQDAHLLFMLNGRPRPIAVFGSFQHNFGAIPIESVERIEVTRGPGSAMYGPNAFSGTVNIITIKTDDSSTTASISGNANDTRTYGRYSFNTSSIDGYVDFFGEKNKGFDDHIEADLQTLLDPMLPTPISLAPGQANHTYDRFSLGVSTQGSRWELNSRFSGIRNAGLGVGALPVLDPIGSYRKDIVDVAGTVDLFNNRNISVNLRGSFNKISSEYRDIHFYPAGAFGVFTNGVVITGRLVDTSSDLSLGSTYSALEKHEITTQISLKYQLLEIKDYIRNFTVDQTIGYIPSEPYNSKGAEIGDFEYGFRLQDEVQLARDLYLTGGVSLDTSEGSKHIISPRLTLVYCVSPRAALKVLYGRGVRLPTTAETSTEVEVPGTLTNPDLRAERLESIDLAASYMFGTSNRLNTNLYYHQTIDQINGTDAGIFGAYPQNTGTQYGHGVELEYENMLENNGKIAFLAAYQRNQVDGLRVGYAPRLKVGVLASKQLTDRVEAGVRIMFSGHSDRPPDDIKMPSSSFARSDLNLTWTPTINQKLGMRIENMFNDRTREPNWHAASPYDSGLPERTIKVTYEVGL